jgi:hypothetical protein
MARRITNRGRKSIRRTKSNISRKQRGGQGKTVRTRRYGDKPFENRENSRNPRYAIRDHADLEKWRDLAHKKLGDAEDLKDKLDAWIEKRLKGYPLEREIELDTYTKEWKRLRQEIRSLVDEYNLTLDDLLTEHKERRPPTLFNRVVKGTEAVLECFGPTCAKWAKQHTPLEDDKPTLLVLRDLIKKIDSKLDTAHSYQNSGDDANFDD